MKNIAIIGAGVTGVTTAYSLLNRGYQVTVFDRNRYAAMQTSFANGGQLSASNAEVWNQTATILKGIKWMFKNDAPLLVNPCPSWHKLSWMAEFCANLAHYRNNTIQTTRMAIAAREHLFDWARRENIDFDHESRGIVHFYGDAKSYKHALAVNDLLREGGLERIAVTPEELKCLEPALQGQFYGGFFTPSDSTGDIHKFTRGLASACRRRGVQFQHEAQVQRLELAGQAVQVNWHRTVGNPADATEQTSFDAVVICAGIHSRRFAAQLGDRVNIYPVKGYSVTVELNDETSQHAAPWVSLLDDEAKIVTSRLGAHRFRIAGTAEFNGDNRDIRNDRIEPLVRWCRRYFPQVNTDRVVPWAGLRPMMPNMMPRVGAGRHAGVFYNTGHGHLGWTLSAATAEILADAMTPTAARRPQPRPAQAMTGASA